VATGGRVAGRNGRSKGIALVCEDNSPLIVVSIVIRLIVLGIHRHGVDIVLSNASE